MNSEQLILRVSLLIANHVGRDYISQADDKLAETLIALCHDNPPWCDDPADLNPEPGYQSPGYGEVRHEGGGHK